MLITVAYLTMQRYGVPAPAARFAIQCLMEMQYRVRTVWGVSDQSYGGANWIKDYNKYPHGAGQGSGDGVLHYGQASVPHVLTS